VNFTADQQKAIDTLDQSVLVSAAAGSGKTAVLVERIIQIVLRGRADVDQMLVVTFSNAAAAEMKNKVNRALKARIRESSGEDRERLRQQLDKMPGAYISTFHSFAMRVIREFFYKIDREPSFRIADDSRIALMKQEAMDELFEQCFEQDDRIEGGSFRDFLRHYSAVRDEDQLKDNMLAIYDKLRSMPNYFDWADDAAAKLRFPASGNMEDSPILTMAKAECLTDLREALKECEDLIWTMRDYGLKTTPEKLEDERVTIGALVEEAESGEDYEQFFNHLNAWTAARLTAGKGERDKYKEISDECKDRHNDYKGVINSLKEDFAGPGIEVYMKEQDQAARYTQYYLNLLKAFEAILDAKKREDSIVDFSDLEHLCVSILEDSEAAESLRDRFRYIFVDEYQDTNPLQEYILSKIARPDNLFKVGDVKQSIYGFRESDPSIFEDTRRAYEDPDNEQAVVIDLNRNFRSNDMVIRYINDVFEDIMPGYDDREKLRRGLPDEPESQLNTMTEVHVLTRSSEEDPQEDEVKDENDEDLTKDEAEAEYTARIVRDLLGTEFYDSSQNVIRPVEPRDIVILSRSIRRKSDAFYKAMLERNIPAYVNDDTGYFDTVEILVATALLSLLNNGYQDLPLAAVLQSGIFGFTPAESAEIRAVYSENGGRSEAYYKAWAYFLEHGEGELGDKARAAEARLNEWRSRENTMPLADYVWYVLNASEWYLCAGAMYGGRQRQANLHMLVDRARAFQESGVASLSGFIRYIAMLKKRKVNINSASSVSEKDNVVRIMTIHKSKGLEYPIVILTGMANKFNFTKPSFSMVMNSKIGLSASYRDPEHKVKRKTLMQKLISRKTKRDEYKEEIRLLYVAMTRAREKLILVGSLNKGKEEAAGESYYGVMKRKLHTPFNRFGMEEAGSRVITGKRNLFEEFCSRRESLDPNRRAESREAVGERLDYRYPNQDAVDTKAKYGVSEILRRREETPGETASWEPDLSEPEFCTVKKVRATDIGTAYHRILQTLDFVKASADETPDTEYIRQTAEQLTASGAIDPDVCEKLELDQIAAFFDSDIGKRASAAAAKGALRKEKSFTLQIKLDEVPTLVQGIIDCFFEEEGGLVLIDYKSSYIGPNGEPGERYKGQIRMYRNALETATGKPVKEAYLYVLRTGKAYPVD